MSNRIVDSWEYKVVEGDMYKDEYEALLNNLGRKGWEVVHVHRICNEPTSITLKRFRGRTEVD